MLKVVKIVSKCFQGKEHLLCLMTLLIFGPCSAEDPVYINHIAVHVEGGHEAANRVARDTGLINKGQVGSLEDHYLLEIPGREKRSLSHSHEHHQMLEDHPDVRWFEQQRVQKRVKRDFQDGDMKFIDPNYKDQWYLHKGAYGHFDMNVQGAWKMGYTGKGVVVTILDDGIERTHTDLLENYDPYASYDVNDRDHDPLPRYDPTNENRHGTRCAGEVSATANNTKCGVGIAYNSRIGGVRMLDGEVFDAVEATSLSFNKSHIDIYSASWGPDDDGRVVDGPGPLAKKAFINGVRDGRAGKGSIFVWASGNGGSAHDSCNCDGYTNSIYTLSISSTSEKGTKPWYLEECSSTLATTYSSGAYNERQITTDDLHNSCTSSHTGTSASAPLAAGIVALILEANPKLTWRDVQYITLMSAKPQPFIDGQWVTNALNRKVSLRYGYGLMDGTKMVEYALQWNNVPEQHICEIVSTHRDIQLNGEPVKLKLKTNGCLGTNREVVYLEHVQAKISLTYHRRGDVKLFLTSPSGTRSAILPRRPNDVRSGSFENWPFLSVHFWGEKASGDWILEIEDASSSRQPTGGGRVNPSPPLSFLYSGLSNYRYNGFSLEHGNGVSSLGTLAQWSLVLYGTSVQPVKLGPEEPPHSPPSVTPTVATPTPTSPPSTYTCHSQCADNCTGPSAKQCVACVNFRISSTGECVRQCPETGFYKYLKECRPCEKSCATCHGPLITDCLTCPSDFILMVKDHVCVKHCLEGFYQIGSQCMKCSRLCKTCKGRSNICTSCRTEKNLKDGKCIDKGETPIDQHLWMPTSIRGVVIVLVVLCSFLLIFIVSVLGLVYARNNQLLCWSYKYNKLPCSDRESLVGLTKGDLENEDELS